MMVDNTNYDIGLALLARRMYSRALDAFDNHIKNYPKHFKSWYFRGHTLGNLGKYEEAINSIDEAIKLNPNEGIAWFFKGKALEYLNKKEESIKVFRIAYILDPDIEKTLNEEDSNYWSKYDDASNSDFLTYSRIRNPCDDDFYLINHISQFDKHFREKILDSIEYDLYLDYKEYIRELEDFNQYIKGEIEKRDKYENGIYDIDEYVGEEWDNYSDFLKEMDEISDEDYYDYYEDESPKYFSPIGFLESGHYAHVIGIILDWTPKNRNQISKGIIADLTGAIFFSIPFECNISFEVGHCYSFTFVEIKEKDGEPYININQGSTISFQEDSIFPILESKDSILNRISNTDKIAIYEQRDCDMAPVGKENAIKDFFDKRKIFYQEINENYEMQKKSLFFPILKEYRNELANQEGIHPKMIFPDKVLHKISQNPPHTFEDFVKIIGFKNRQVYFKFFRFLKFCTEVLKLVENFEHCNKDQAKKIIQILDPSITTEEKSITVDYYIKKRLIIDPKHLSVLNFSSYYEYEQRRDEDYYDDYYEDGEYREPINLTQSSRDNSSPLDLSNYRDCEGQKDDYRNYYLMNDYDN